MNDLYTGLKKKKNKGKVPYLLHFKPFVFIISLSRDHHKIFVSGHLLRISEPLHHHINMPHNALGLYNQ